MTRYEEAFDTDWETLDPDEASERAYAIGVAERLGENNREYLERIYDEMDTTYEKSMVELAFQEGRNEAADAADGDGMDSLDEIWTDLVTGEVPDIDREEALTGGREGLPESLDGSEVLDRLDVDSTDALDRPDFLDR